MDFSIVLESLPKLGEGFVLTIQLTALALLIGFILSLPIAVFAVQKNLAMKSLSSLYIFCLRGTPLLVQIFLVYYGLSQFEWIRNSPFWSILKEPFWCAIIALSFNTSAYNAEILRGAFLAIPRGHLDAAASFGMSPMTCFRRIIWPQAVRIGLPAYGNEVILLIKASSLVSVITLLDLTGMAKNIVAETYKPIELYLTIAMGYFLLTAMAGLLFRRLEGILNKRQLTQVDSSHTQL